MSELKQQISKMFREDYYLRNRVSQKDFYEFRDRVVELVGDLEKSHIIKSRQEIQEMIDKTPIGDRKLRFTTGYIHALEKLLGDESKSSGGKSKNAKGD